MKKQKAKSPKLNVLGRDDKGVLHALTTTGEHHTFTKCPPTEDGAGTFVKEGAHHVFKPVEVVYEAAPDKGKGPAKVATKAFRNGWDTTFKN